MIFVRTGLLIASAVFLRGQLKVDVDVVNVACSVTDRGGAPAKNLKAEDFVVKDNGDTREIKYFWQESDLPLTIALVADVSGSQAGFVKNHRKAVAQFLSQVIGPKDRAMLVEVAQQAWLVRDLTSSVDELNAAVEAIGTPEGKNGPVLGGRCGGGRHGCGGTALWHALYYTSRLGLRPMKGRKAIIVLSDGMDTGSDRSLTDVIEMTQSAEAVVYTIKYENPLRFISPTATLLQALSRGLERLSRETGGVSFLNPGRKTSAVFAQIESELRNSYVVGFTPPEDARDGKFHKLDVKTTRKDLVVRYRAGYYARETLAP